MGSASRAAAEHQLVVFELAGEAYGVEIGVVREIITMPKVTPVPQAPDYVEGVLDLRGRVVPVIDLKRRLGLPGAERGRETRIMVMEVDGRTVGCVVDAVTEVLNVTDDVVEPPPETVTATAGSYLRGIAKLADRLIILIGPQTLLGDAAWAPDEPA